MGQVCCLSSARGKTKEDKEEMNKELPLLPYDAVYSILVRLPVKCLLRFRCLSKQWNRTITLDINFAAEHRLIQQQREALCDVIYMESREQCIPARFPILNIMPQVDLKLIECPFFLDEEGVWKRWWVTCGSCHGLLCVVVHSTSIRGRERWMLSIVIWNSATRQYREVPYPVLMSGCTINESDAGFLGFGYDPATSDYKILVVDSSFLTPATYSSFRIHSLKTNASETTNQGRWRTAGRIRNDRFGHRMPQPVSMDDGHIYWIARIGERPTFRFELFKFSMVKERLAPSVPLPAPASQKYDFEKIDDCYCRLGQRSGSSLTLYWQNKTQIHMWTNEDSSGTSWSPVAAITYLPLARDPGMGFMMDGAIVSISERNLVVYRHKEKKSFNCKLNSHYKTDFRRWDPTSVHLMQRIETLLLP